MKNDFSKIIKTIEKFQKNTKDIETIDKEKNNVSINSEFYQKYKEILEKFTNEGYIYESDIIGKNYDEVLSYLDRTINNSANNFIKYYKENSTQPDLKELEEIYNMTPEEEKKEYPTFNDFVNYLANEEKKEREKRIANFDKLRNVIKDLKESKVKIDEQLITFDEKKEKLEKERERLLEVIPKNCNLNLIENGFEFKNGFPVIKDQIPLVDRKPVLDEKTFSIDDLIMVHATDYFPKRGVIESNRDSTGSKRNTVHTALNGRVGSHTGGNWDKCPIVILDPLKYHIDQVECLYAVDTFTYGSMKLSSSALILINVNNFDQLYAKNKEYIDNNHDRVVLFSGDSVQVVENLLSFLGYVPEKIGSWNWDDQRDAMIMDRFLNKNYPNISHTSHNATEYSRVEKSDLRNEVLPKLGINDTGEDMIIDLSVLYAIRQAAPKRTLASVILDAGLFVKDDEIHLLGIKDHAELLKKNDVSPFQIQKIALLLKKYEMMLQKGLKEENDEEEHRRLG